MVTITFQAEQNDSKLQNALNYLKSLGLAFRIKEETPKEEDDDETVAVRERLRLKYVVTGEWKNMDEEDREDAVLLETMLWKREQPDYEVLSEEETMNILARLKEGKL
jgi:hypothetical protein